MSDNNHSISQYKAIEADASRFFNITEHDYRDKFQRDRDRILYSKEFRRLSGKTQIFVTGSDDNMRTRLTHTLEVSQIAETISANLGLNTMLTRAIALGHDIGHTPFGHVGERTLNYIMNGCIPYYGYADKLREEDKGFKHNLQGVRVACLLENKLDEEINGKSGLNLTRNTLWGIKNHSSLGYKKECDYCQNHNTCQYKNRGTDCSGSLSVGYYNQLLEKLVDERDWTLEGVIVAYADEIAQRHHDIEDGIYAGLIDIEQLIEYMKDVFSLTSMSEKLNEIENTISNYHYEKNIAIKELSRLIVNSYVTDYKDNLYHKVKQVEKELDINAKNNSNWKEMVYFYVSSKYGDINSFFGFSDEFKKADNQFSDYLCNHILYSNVAQCMDGKASFIIRQLVKAYLTNPQQLPDGTIIAIIGDWNDVNSVQDINIMQHMTEASKARDRLKKLLTKGDADISRILMRRICDHIAGMTDQYAMTCFERLYGSKGYEYR